MPHELFCAQFAEKYGKVFSLSLFGGRIVVINGYKLVREALVEKGQDYTDRPFIPLVQDFGGNKGSVCCILFQQVLGHDDTVIGILACSQLLVHPVPVT